MLVSVRMFCCVLHSIVSRSSAALWAGPHYVLGGVFDAAGLAVDAVLGVDDQFCLAGLVVFGVLVDAGGAEAALGTVVDGVVVGDWDGVVFEGQMGGLVAFVVGAGE